MDPCAICHSGLDLCPSDRALAGTGTEQQRTISQPPTAVFGLSAERPVYHFLSVIYCGSYKSPPDGPPLCASLGFFVAPITDFARVAHHRHHIWMTVEANHTDNTPVMESGLGCRLPTSDRGGIYKQNLVRDHQYLVERIAPTASKSTRKCVFYASLCDR